MRNVRSRILAAAVLVAAASAATIGTLLTQAAATPSVSTDRVAGSTRYDTARVIAEYKQPGASGFAFGSPSQAVLVSGDNYPDALSASFLAGQYKSPTLLTARDALRSEAVQAFKDMGISQVTIVGGPFAVAASEDDALRAEGITPTRIAGANRDDTAAKVAQAANTVVGTWSNQGSTALLAADNDAHHVDALSAGALAWSAHLPLLLTPTETLAPEAKAALQNLNIHHVIILGGTAAVSADVETSITDMGLTTERFQGATRQQTAIAVANAEHNYLNFLFTRVFLAQGNNFPDSLAGGPIAGLLKNPILLTLDTNTLGSDSKAFLTENDGTVNEVTALGGINAVSDAALNDAGQSSKCTTATTSGLPIPGAGPMAAANSTTTSTTAKSTTTTTTKPTTTTTSTTMATTTTTIPTCATTTTSTPTSTSTSTTAPGGTTSTTACAVTPPAC